MIDTKTIIEPVVDPKLKSILDNYEKDKEDIKDEITTNRKELGDSIAYLLRENKNRMLDIDNVKGNLQASYDHLIDKIEKLRDNLIIAVLALSVAMIIMFVCAGTVMMDKDDDRAESVTTVENSNNMGYEFGIVQVKNTNQPEIIYDKDTKVMYFVSDNGNHTVMLNSDGTPKLFNNEEE